MVGQAVFWRWPAFLGEITVSSGPLGPLLRVGVSRVPQRGYSWARAGKRKRMYACPGCGCADTGVTCVCVFEMRARVRKCDASARSTRACGRPDVSGSPTTCSRQGRDRMRQQVG